MQGLGYGFTMSIYATVHLLSSRMATKSSPTLARNVRTEDIIIMKNLTTSIIVGYILPAVLMTIPVSSSVLHQWLGGFWQGFPVWVTLLQYIFGFLHKKFGSAMSEDAHSHNSDRSTVSDRTGEMRALHGAYLFAFGVSAFTHIATFVLLGARKLFPSLFSSVALATLNIDDVLLPPMLYSHANMKDMAIGIQNYF